MLPAARQGGYARIRERHPKTGTRLSVLDHKYGSGPPLTIGVEEEYMLLDARTLELGGTIDDVLGGAARPAVGEARDAGAVRVDAPRSRPASAATSTTRAAT